MNKNNKIMLHNILLLIRIKDSLKNLIILFPLVFSGNLSKFYEHIDLIFGFIISLIFTELRIRNNPSETFYFLHTRMWELLAGSILAYYEIRLGYRCKNNVLNKIFCSL